MKKITILALDKAVASSVIGTMDIFYQAGLTWNYLFGRDPIRYFDVEIVTRTGKPVKGLNGISIQPHRSMADVESTDIIMVSSFFDYDILKGSRETFDWLNEHHSRGTTLASICVGSFVLAEAGLLDGKTATTHWGFANEFRRRYPRVKLLPEQLITDEGDLLCSGACNSYIDLSLYLIERFFGRKLALECAKTMLHDFGRSSQTPYMVFQFPKSHGDTGVCVAQEWIEQHYKEKINISALSDLHGMSQRAFERRFKQATGDSPLFYLQRVRVEAAKRMLETGNRTFNEITYSVGYEDSSFFRKLFKKHTGLLPKTYRQKFQATW